MKAYAIRHVSLLSAFRFGFVIGATALLIPGILAGIGTALLIAGVEAWLGSWPEVSRFGLEIRLLELLNLTALAAWLERMVGWGWRFPLLIASLVVGLGGLSTGITTLLSATTYNFLAALSGGLVVDLEEVRTVPQRPPAFSAYPPVAYSPRVGPRLQATNSGQHWPLTPAGVTLGSAANATIVLPGLAPRHAEIRFENNKHYVLYDFSSGQTWVEGRPIQGANLLKPGFRLRLGPHELVFHNL
ncbi:MAG: FHA domain-containing protein [Caldilineaceae bacterium]|nr:FHA domain-containing protein [Caldilineaceae bacterium]